MKRLEPVVDKNGVQTSRWKNDESPTPSARVSNLPVVGDAPTSAFEVSQTGDIGDGISLWKHAVIDRDSQLKAVLDQHPDVDFVSVRRTGWIDFMHVTVPDNEQRIANGGLQIAEGVTGDLGSGVYVIDPNDPNGCDNLMTYLSEHHDSNGRAEILVVRGTTNTTYLECIYGEGHAGYIMLESPVAAEDITDVSVRTVEALENDLFQY